MNNAPILAFICPLPGDVHHHQIKHFQQTFIGREYGFRLSNLAQLAVESLYGVGGINQCLYLLRILKIRVVRKVLCKDQTSGKSKSYRATFILSSKYTIRLSKIIPQSRIGIVHLSTICMVVKYRIFIRMNI